MKTPTWILLLVLVASGILLWKYIDLDKKYSKLKIEAAADKEPAEKWAFLIEKADQFRKTTEALSKERKLNSNGFTDPKRALDYINYYRLDSTKLRGVCHEGKKPPTMSLWVDDKVVYSLARFLVEERSDSTDGTRLYLSKYPKYQPDSQGVGYDPLRNYPGDQGQRDNMYTAIFVATRNEGGAHLNFFKKYDSKMFINSDNYEGLYNYHDLCPPSTGCYAFDTIPEPPKIK